MVTPCGLPFFMPTVDIQKIKDTCKCLDPLLTDLQIEALFLPTIRVISELTGWGNGECSTMYKGLREQVHEYEACNCRCECKEPIMLENRLVDPTTLAVELYLVNNSGETKFTLQSQAIKYSKIENSIRLDLTEQVLDETNTLIDFRGNCCRCDKYYVRVTYEAGYVELPQCVIDSICWLYNYLNLQKIGADCSQASCQNLDRLGYDAKLTSVKVGDISYTYDYPNSTLLSTFNNINLSWLNRFHEIDNQINIKQLGIW